MPEMTPEQQKALQEKIKNMSPEELRQFQKQQCIFCQIIAGKVPSQKVYEDDKCFAVLDINPANKGHILLLTKEHYAIMPQVPEDEISHLFIVSKYLSQAQLKAFKAQGTTVFVANGVAAGQRAQHFMVHLIPRFENDGVKALDIPQKEINETDLQKLRELLINKINQVFGMKKETVVEKKKPKEAAPVVKVEEKEIKEEKYVTSAKAKRFHISACPFAQKINKEKRIHITQEEAASSGRKPCECTGLVPPQMPKRTKKKKSKPKPSSKSEKGLGKSKTSQRKTKEGASLNEIAELFK